MFSMTATEIMHLCFDIVESDMKLWKFIQTADNYKEGYFQPSYDYQIGSLWIIGKPIFMHCNILSPKIW